MKTNILRLMVAAPAALALTAFVHHPGGGGAPLEASLTGAAEVPGPGDPDGMGMIKLRLNPGQGEVCYSLMTMNVDGVWGAHIHQGGAGVAGNVVVNLEVDNTYDGMEEKCVDAARGTVTNILRNPSGYYVNVHSTEFNAGAVRGQLEGLRSK